MKAMVISDIHGGIKYLEEALSKFMEEKADRLLILGDFAGYFSSSSDYEVAEALNKIADKMCAVRGNCDSERFEEMLNFGLMDIRSINLNKNIITLTHGHLYNKYNLPEYCGDIFISGHTHYGMIDKQQTRIFANPGSISRPRNGSQRSYLIIDENKIILKNLEGQVLVEENINDWEMQLIVAKFFCYF